MTGKLIIFSAPSGSGKSTIINYLLTQNLNLAFSISATSRPPRGTDAPEVIESRIAKAEYELGFAPQFDCVIVNDNLETAKAEALKVIKEFLEQ